MNKKNFKDLLTSIAQARKIYKENKMKDKQKYRKHLENKYLEKSKCCNANVKIEGKTTHYYVCLKCGKTCDVK